MAVLLFVVLFWQLGGASFWDPDEAHYAEASRELLRTGDWLAPYYNEQPFFDKPILFYWLQAVSEQIFGRSEFALRLLPAAFGLGTCLIVYATARAIWTRRAGLLAAVCLAVLYVSSSLGSANPA